mmetsp:Transcript_82497/g.260441  ORF Transcript_82497/g.260441 Transcript_82497/m.260441 type:complete len:1217 (+) Transcript_82497:285-3935(+)
MHLALSRLRLPLHALGALARLGKAVPRLQPELLVLGILLLRELAASGLHGVDLQRQLAAGDANVVVALRGLREARQARLGDLDGGAEGPQPQVGHAQVHVGRPVVGVQQQAPVKQVPGLLYPALVQRGHAEEVERVRVGGQEPHGVPKVVEGVIPALGKVRLGLLGVQDAVAPPDEGHDAVLHRDPADVALDDLPGPVHELSGLAHLAHGHAQPSDQVRREGRALRVLPPERLGRRLGAAEELLDRVAQGGVHLPQVGAAHGSRARGPRGADDALAEVLRLHVRLRELPVAPQPIDLQVLRVQAVPGVALLAPRPAPQREGHAHRAIVWKVVLPGRDGRAPALHDEDRVLVGPPVPLLLVEGALNAKLVSWPVLQAPDALGEPGLRRLRRTQDLLQDVVELAHGHHDDACRPGAVAELQHHVVALAHTQGAGDAPLELRRVPPREVGLLRHQVLVAGELHEVMGDLLVRGHEVVLAENHAVLEVVAVLDTLRDLGTVAGELGRPAIARLQHLDTLQHGPPGVVLEIYDAPEDGRDLVRLRSSLRKRRLDLQAHYVCQSARALDAEDPAVVVVRDAGSPSSGRERAARRLQEELAGPEPPPQLPQGGLGQRTARRHDRGHAGHGLQRVLRHRAGLALPGHAVLEAGHEDHDQVRLAGDAQELQAVVARAVELGGPPLLGPHLCAVVRQGAGCRVCGLAGFGPALGLASAADQELAPQLHPPIRRLDLHVRGALPGGVAQLDARRVQHEPIVVDLPAVDALALEERAHFGRARAALLPHGHFSQPLHHFEGGGVLLPHGVAAPTVRSPPLPAAGARRGRGVLAKAQLLQTLPEEDDLRGRPVHPVGVRKDALRCQADLGLIGGSENPDQEGALPRATAQGHALEPQLDLGPGEAARPGLGAPVAGGVRGVLHPQALAEHLHGLPVILPHRLVGRAGCAQPLWQGLPICPVVLLGAPPPEALGQGFEDLVGRRAAGPVWLSLGEGLARRLLAGLVRLARACGRLVAAAPHFALQVAVDGRVELARALGGGEPRAGAVEAQPGALLEAADGLAQLQPTPHGRVLLRRQPGDHFHADDLESGQRALHGGWLCRRRGPQPQHGLLVRIEAHRHHLAEDRVGVLEAHEDHVAMNIRVLLHAEARSNLQAVRRPLQHTPKFLDLHGPRHFQLQPPVLMGLVRGLQDNLNHWPARHGRAQPGHCHILGHVRRGQARRHRGTHGAM